MEIIAINLNEGNNKEIYWGNADKFKKEWDALVNDPENRYDPVEFYKRYGKDYPEGYTVETVGKPATIQEALIERFYSLFRQKILGESSIDYYYIEDPYNYDENGNYLYDDDGNLLSSHGHYGIYGSHPEKILSSNMGADKLIASSSDGIFVAEAAVDNDDNSVIESENSENSEVQNDESEDDYSNGRIDIWKTYIKELNMTGHDEMGAVAEDGEVLAHAHNAYLQVAYDHGIIVGILFGLLIVAGMAISGVYYFRNRESFGALVPFSVITGFAIAGLTEWNFQLCNPMTVALMLCLPAIMFRVRKEQ